jgi:hypothetical protein
MDRGEGGIFLLEGGSETNQTFDWEGWMILIEIFVDRI